MWSDWFVFDQRIAVGQSLAEREYTQCFACRMPLTEAERNACQIEQGVSCPRCFDQRSYEQQQRYRDRQATSLKRTDPMQQQQAPILYSFCRCPYAMRARMALLVSNTACRLREVRLSDKPAEMIAISAKATVPVLALEDGTVIDESIAVMRWALERNDPHDWLADSAAAQPLIATNDGEFKHHLDRYKYANRYQDSDLEAFALQHRHGGEQFLVRLENLLQKYRHLLGERSGIADHAIFPFIRQFANHDRDWFNALPYPRLQAWLTGHLQSELFTITMKKHKPWQSGETEPLWPESLAAAWS